jgi:hypothetical protein
MSIPAPVDGPTMHKIDPHRQRPCLVRALAVGAALAGALAPPTAAAAVSPTSYAAHPLCSTPAPGQAGCLALGLAPRTAAASDSLAARSGAHRAPAAGFPAATIYPEPWPGSLSPLEVQSAYSLPPTPPSPQTIAIVDAFDDANIVADLAKYSKRFLGASGGPPACTIGEGKIADPVGGLAEGCFLKVNQYGDPLAEGPREEPPTSKGSAAQSWAGEIATDVELAHGLCQSCRIVLVEASSESFQNLEAAEDEAAALGANEISNSWGGEEPAHDSEAFNHPDVAITFSAGDSGYLDWTDTGKTGYFDGVDYPASSPHVVAVGGTTLKLSGGSWQDETVWNEDPDPYGEDSGAGGGGCSASFKAPAWQEAVSGWSAVGCGEARAVADVAADADPYTGVAVYDSTPDPGMGGNSGWAMIGGTSVASPIVAATFALAGGAGSVKYPAATLYSHVGSTALHDVVEGGNGECKGLYSSCSGSLSSALDCGAAYTICHAAAGYDGPTGVGTPDGIGAFQPNGNPEAPKEEGAKKGGSKGGSGSGEEGSPKGGSGGPEEGGEGTPPSEGTASGGGGGSSITRRAVVQPPSSSSGTATAGSGPLSNLALTFNAIAALSRGRPRTSQMAFTFTLSAPMSVRVTLARQVTVHRHSRWAKRRGSFTIAAVQGTNQAHLRSHHELRPGHYLLTLIPAQGASQSLAVVIG